MRINMSPVEFMEYLQNNPRLVLSEYAANKINAFINCLDENVDILGEVVELIAKNDRRYLHDIDIFSSISEVLKKHAANRARCAKIEKWSGTDYEESIVLSQYFYRLYLRRYQLDFLL